MSIATCGGCDKYMDMDATSEYMYCPKCNQIFCEECAQERFPYEMFEEGIIETMCNRCRKIDEVEHPEQHQWKTESGMADELDVRDENGDVVASNLSPSVAERIVGDHNDLIKARVLLRDIKKLWDEEGFGSDENISEPLFMRLKEMLV